MNYTLLTADQLSKRVPYCVRHIREYLKDRIFIEGYHYVRTPGGRRLFFVWERIESDLLNSFTKGSSIPMASGGYFNG